MAESITKMEQQIASLLDRVQIVRQKDRRGFHVYALESVHNIDLQSLQRVLRRYGANAFLRMGANTVKVDVYVPKHTMLRRAVIGLWVGFFVSLGITLHRFL